MDSGPQHDHTIQTHHETTISRPIAQVDRSGRSLSDVPTSHTKTPGLQNLRGEGSGEGGEPLQRSVPLPCTKIQRGFMKDQEKPDYSRIIRHLRGGVDSVEKDTQAADCDFADHNRGVEDAREAK